MLYFILYFPLTNAEDFQIESVFNVSTFMACATRILRQFCTNSRKSLWESTIYALSSGYGKCGVAVIRVSGPKACEVIYNVVGMKTLPAPRQAVLRRLRNPVTKEILDKGLVLWFPGPKSFTGEDVCELHVHGGHAVISSVLNALSTLLNFLPAEPGEFTRRAFHNGKLDLTEVEGLADLLAAETEAQRKQAFLQMEGSLSKLYNTWRQSLLKGVAQLEAFIDFGEDENIEDDVVLRANISLLDLKKSIENHVNQSECGERLRDGVRTVILGEPNVGKSSLLNALCKRPAAIVTPLAGTTRDVVEVRMNVAGYPVLLADTAGLRNSTDDVVEKEGIVRAKSYANSAELLLLVADARKCTDMPEFSENAFETTIKKYTESLGIKNLFAVNSEILCKRDISLGDQLRLESHSKCTAVILNKCDLVADKTNIYNITRKYSNVVPLSCKTEEGFSFLFNGLTQMLGHLCGNPSEENPHFTQARHRYHLNECLNNLEDYFKISNADGDTVLAVQKLRSALRNLGKITGHVSTEQILDVIFKEFCIGK